MANAVAPVLVLNPIAGDGAGGRLVPQLEAQLGRRNAELRVSTRRGHAEELAAEAIRDGADRVVGVGGDGTMQEVVNGIISAGGGALGVVPVGRGNDLARSLGIPIEPLAALDIALGPVLRTMDVGRAIRGSTLRHFVAAGGVGFDAQVSWTMANPRPWWKNGRAGYFAGTIDELRRFHNQRLRITFDLDSGREVVDHTSLMVAFANGPYYGGGMKICPDASLTDGRLDVCVVGDLSRLEALRELPGLYQAKHVGHPKVRFYRTRWILIEGDEPTRVHLDGERWGTLPIRVEALPAALNVAAPATAAP